MTLYRHAWTMQLREGAGAAYDAAHADLWPEMRAQMRASGIRRFFLYRSGRTVFAFQERDRPFTGTTAPPSELTARWWRAMAPLMETQGPDHQPVHHPLCEVFALDTTSEATT
jgi:L-rhamnose mutarotase